MPDIPRPPLNDELDMALCDGLRRLPAPPVSADFDARVLAALALLPPLSETLRVQFVSALRPLLCGAACSLALTLLALFWTLHAPVSLSSPSDAPRAVRALDMAAVDDLLSRPNLGASSLSVWARQSALPTPVLAVPPVHPDAERRRGADHRRASRPFPTLLTA